MEASEILKEMSEDEDLLAGVIGGLAMGMWDEWDCGLEFALVHLGPAEVCIAARTGAIMIKRVEEVRDSIPGTCVEEGETRARSN